MVDGDTLQLMHQRVRDRRVIPFIGAGISQPVLQKGWEETIREVAGEARGLLRVTRKELDTVLRTRGRGPTVAAEILRQELEGKPLADAVRKVLLEPGQRPDPAHLAMVTGPWPAMVTTNWDDFLEQAWASGSAVDEPPAQAHRAWGKRLRVFYRKDIESFHAHLKAGVRPLLFKMHGDFSTPDEFVLGQTDYRRLLVRDISLRSLMLLLTAEYSLLFYGCSMTDPDVLEFLAATHEGLGHGIGPHFWLTFDDVTRALSHFLLRHYNLRVVRVEPAELQPTLRRIAGAGWDVPGRTEVAVQVNGRITVQITGHPMPHVSRAREREAFAISVGTTRQRVVEPSTAPGSQMLEVLGRTCAADGMVLDSSGIGTCEVEGRRVWLVSGQEPGGQGRTGYVHRAVRSLIAQTVAARATRLHLPLIAAGGGRLPARECLHAMLHAIGAAVGRVHVPRFTIVIHVYQPAGEFSPISDIAEGRIVPARILERGRTGQIRCAAIHPAPDALGRVVCSSVFTTADGTVADLLEQLRLPSRPSKGRWRLRYQRGDRSEVSLRKATASLEALDVTDGTLIAIEPPA